MIKKIDQKEVEQLKQTYNHYNDKRKEIMDSTKFKNEDILADVINEDSISPEQTTKPKNFLSQKM